MAIQLRSPNIHDKLVISLNKAIEKGKVLDVSNLAADGTGSRAIRMPKTGKGTKKWIDNFPVLSDNYASYLLAMKIFGPEYIVYADQFLQLYGAAPMVRSPRRAGPRTPPKSPKKYGPPIIGFPIHPKEPLVTIPTEIVPKLPSPKIQPNISPIFLASPMPGPTLLSPGLRQSQRIPTVQSPLVLPSPSIFTMPTPKLTAIEPPKVPSPVAKMPSPKVPTVTTTTRSPGFTTQQFRQPTAFLAYPTLQKLPGQPTNIRQPGRPVAVNPN